MKYARELHDRFRKENSSVCCRVLTKNIFADSPERKKQCAELTGEVVEIVTGIILREAKYSKCDIGKVFHSFQTKSNLSNKPGA